MPLPRVVAGRVVRHLTGLGFIGVRQDGNWVRGIPFVEMHCTTEKRPAGLPPASDGVHVQWSIPRGRDIEEDVVRIRAIHFAPMLQAWVEQERKRRSE